jgi:hypothetical protein
VAPGINLLDNTVTRTPDEFRSRTSTPRASSARRSGPRQPALPDGGAAQRRLQHLRRLAAAALVPEVQRGLGRDPHAERRAEPLPRVRQAAHRLGPGRQRAAGLRHVFGFSAATWRTPATTRCCAPRGRARRPLHRHRPAQPDLGPERTTEFEVGADFSFARDRVGLGITFYDATTEDAIFLAPLSPSTGFFQQLQNAADIRNRGFEVTLDVRPVRPARSAGSWAATGPRTTTRCSRWATRTASSSHRHGGFVGISAVVGHPIGVMRGNDFARCGQDERARGRGRLPGRAGGRALRRCERLPDPGPGARDRRPHPGLAGGDPQQLHLLGALQLSTLVDVKRGGDVWNGTRGALYSYGTHADTEVRGSARRRWRTVRPAARATRWSSYGDFAGAGRRARA